MFAYFYLKDGKKDVDLDSNLNREYLYMAILPFTFDLLVITFALIVRVYSDLYNCEYNGILVDVVAVISTILLYKYFKYIKIVDVAKEKYNRIPYAVKKRRVIYWRLFVVFIVLYAPIALILSGIIRFFISNE